MVNSKNKGGTFEREISKLMSKRFLLKTGLSNSFRRNIDSGAFFGGSNISRVANYATDKATFGDIVCPDGFVYSLECKHYKVAPSFSLLLKQDCKEWDKWIKQASQDCKVGGKEFVLIIKYNNVDIFVILDKLVGDLKPTILYKEYFIVPFSQWIGQEDSVFFS